MSKAQLLVSEARRRQHLTVNQRVLGSSPRGGAKVYKFFAQILHINYRDREFLTPFFYVHNYQ